MPAKHICVDQLAKGYRREVKKAIGGLRSRLDWPKGVNDYGEPDVSYRRIGMYLGKPYKSDFLEMDWDETHPDKGRYGFNPNAPHPNKLCVKWDITINAQTGIVLATPTFYGWQIKNGEETIDLMSFCQEHGMTEPRVLADFGPLTQLGSGERSSDISFLGINEKLPTLYVPEAKLREHQKALREALAL